jgi:hypothetical protein
MSERLTVVIPSYKVSATVGRTIRSVLAQAASSVDIVAVIDGPDPESRAALEPFADRITIVQVDINQGPQATRKRGLEEADEDGFVIFLDGDDYWEGDLAGPAVRQMIEHDADIGLAAMVVEAARDGRRTLVSLAHRTETEIFEGWLGRNEFVAPCAVVWRVSFLRRIGDFDTSLQRQEDGEMVCRALIEGARVTHLKSGVAVYVQHWSPHRLTVRNDNLGSLLDVPDKILRMPPGAIPRDSVVRAVAESYANAQRTFALRGREDLAEQAAKRSAALGPARPQVAGLLGWPYRLLPTKVAIAVERAIRKVAGRPY